MQLEDQKSENAEKHIDLLASFLKKKNLNYKI